ncbi:MAG: CCA tRNA nucleotidyltransferase [Candidatus Methanosuratincola sp.]|jgi:poly(A) polymerase
MERVFKLPPTRSDMYDAAKEVHATLVSRGYRAFMVGGCVRDMVLGETPHEYDIATSATPEEIASLFPRTIPVGASFGVVLVIHKGFKFEVATFRRDEGYSDGRHPDRVSYSPDEREDVRRRDFTINALLYDPVAEQAIDYVGALEDIKEGVIRAIGKPEDRFEEDRLRMLRAVRFSARLGFRIEEGALRAIRQLAPLIATVSRERIRDEIVRIITQKNPGVGLRLMLDLGLLKYLLPDVAGMAGVPQPQEYHPEGDVFTHTCLVLDYLRDYTLENRGEAPTPELAMGALLHDVGKPPTFSITDRIRFNGHDKVGAAMAQRICMELRFSKKQTHRISELVRHHLKFKDVFYMRRSTLRRFLAMPHFEDHLALHYADCMGSHRELETYEFVKQKLEEYKETDIKPKPLLSGDDLIAMGYKPGPIFSEILRQVEEAQLQGDLRDKESAKSMVRELFPLDLGA